MGRNIFQSDNPPGMMRAVTAVVHDGKTPEEALEIYRSSKERRLGRAPGADKLLSIGITTADWMRM